MATYAIGDVQGCYDELQQLLTVIHFHPSQDVLWFCGDLVNRGPQSLAVLRFIQDLKNTRIVLGNHDLHLLAVNAGASLKNNNDTFDDVLAAPDCQALCDWLRRQPLLYHDAESRYTLIHAGLPPQWDLQQAQSCAQEVEVALQGKDYVACLQHLYGNEPRCWSPDLTGWERLRFSVNCLTRLRFCDEEGNVHLEFKGPLGSQPLHLLPWYQVTWRLSKDLQILFGHWAALVGKINTPNVVALDAGCVWGGHLSAFCLENHKTYQVSCRRYAKY